MRIHSPALKPIPVPLKKENNNNIKGNAKLLLSPQGGSCAAATTLLQAGLQVGHTTQQLPAAAARVATAAVPPVPAAAGPLQGLNVKGRAHHPRLTHRPYGDAAVEKEKMENGKVSLLG